MHQDPPSAHGLNIIGIEIVFSGNLLFEHCCSNISKYINFILFLGQKRGALKLCLWCGLRDLRKLGHTGTDLGDTFSNIQL